MFVSCLEPWSLPVNCSCGSINRKRKDNLDTYLPLWLAQYHQGIFGTLFVAAELYIIWQWFTSPA